MPRSHPACRRVREPLGRLVLALGAALCIALALGLPAAVAAGPRVPCSLPVTLPADTTSPTVDGLNTAGETVYVGAGVLSSRWPWR